MKPDLVKLCLELRLVSGSSGSAAQPVASTPNGSVTAPSVPETALKAEDRAQLNKLKRQVAAIAAQRRTEQANMVNFDDLDFNVYSGQK